MRHVDLAAANFLARLEEGEHVLDDLVREWLLALRRQRVGPVIDDVLLAQAVAHLHGERERDVVGEVVPLQ
eukprot:546525-Prymnesium_polylepis.1